MRYIKTVDLWNPEISYLVRSGQLKLQKGQWIKCGSDKLSRFVRILYSSGGGTIHAAHWNGSSKARQERFKTLCELKGYS